MAVDRHELVKHQLRDSHGRWIKMGFHVKWSDLSGEHVGTVVDVDTSHHLGDPNPRAVVRLYGKHGEDLGQTQKIDGTKLTVIDAKAILHYDHAGNPTTDPHTGLALHPKSQYSAHVIDGNSTRLSGPHFDASKDLPEHHGVTTPLKHAKVGDQLYPVSPEHGNGTSPYNLKGAHAAPVLDTSHGKSLGTVVENKPEKGYIKVRDENGKEYYPSKKHWGVVRNADSDAHLIAAHKDGLDYGTANKGRWTGKLADQHHDIENPDHADQALAATEHGLVVNALDNIGLGYSIKAADHSKLTQQVEGLKAGDQVYSLFDAPKTGSYKNPYGLPTSIDGGKVDVRVNGKDNPSIGTVVGEGPTGLMLIKDSTGHTFQVPKTSWALKRTPERDAALLEATKNHPDSSLHKALSAVPEATKPHEPAPEEHAPAPEPKPEQPFPVGQKAEDFQSPNSSYGPTAEHLKVMPIGTIARPDGSKGYFVKTGDNSWQHHNKEGVAGQTITGQQTAAYLPGDTSLWLPKGADVVPSGNAEEAHAKLHASDAAPKHENQPLSAVEAEAKANGETVLYHGGLPEGTTLADINLNRNGTQQNKKGKSYGGFYLTDDSSKKWSEDYAMQRNGVMHGFAIDKNAKIDDRGNAQIDRLSAEERAEAAKHFDLIKGKDLLGRTQYVLLNKDVVKGVGETNIKDGHAPEAPHEAPAFDAASFDGKKLSEVPEEHVNDLPAGTKVVKSNGDYWLKHADGSWDSYKASGQSNGLKSFKLDHGVGSLYTVHVPEDGGAAANAYEHKDISEYDGKTLKDLPFQQIKDLPVGTKIKWDGKDSEWYTKDGENHWTRYNEYFPNGAGTNDDQYFINHKDASGHHWTIELPKSEENHSEAPAEHTPAVEEPKAEAPHEDPKAEEPKAYTPIPGEYSDKGKTVVNADGETLQVNQHVLNDKYGHGVIAVVMPATNGGSVKVKYDSEPQLKVTLAKKLKVDHSQHGEAPKAEEAHAPAEVGNIAPGDTGIHPEHGKLFIGDKNGQPLVKGDKVSYTKKGETFTGTVKSIYKGEKTVAIEWDNGGKTGPKKASTLSKVEDKAEHAPQAPEAPAAAEETAPVAEPHDAATVKAMSDYFDHGMQINAHLRGTSENAYPGAESIIYGLDDAIEKSALNEDTKVYRAFKLPPAAHGNNTNAVLSALTEGGNFFDKGFTSTSLDPAKADEALSHQQGFHQIHVEYDLPKGFHALAMDYKAIGTPEAEKWAHQKEVVLPRNMNFQVTHADVTHNEDGSVSAKIRLQGVLMDGTENLSSPDMHEVASNAPVDKHPFEMLADPGKSGDGFHPSGPWGHYGAAGLLVGSKNEKGEPVFLIVENGELHEKKNQGLWQLPGGAIDEHENAYTGSAREMHEELGVTPELMKSIEHVGDVKFENGKGWAYTNVAAMSEKPFDVKIDVIETSDYKWATKDELAQMVHDGKILPALAQNLDNILGLYDGHEGFQSLGKTEEAPHAGPDKLLDINDFEKVPGHTQGGSNSGALYTDKATGEQYYIKWGMSEDHADNEVLASKIYQALGVNAGNQQLIDMGNGKVGVASKIIENQGGSGHAINDPEFKKKAQEDFAADALLANWDVAGMGMDNLMVDKNGNPLRIDPGASLRYRAQGAKKSDFGPSVGEWKYLRDGSNHESSGLPYNKKVFGDMTDQQLKDSAAKLHTLTDDKIDSIVDSVPFDKKDNEYFKEVLKARRDDIFKRAGIEGINNSKETHDAGTAAEPAAEQHAGPESGPVGEVHGDSVPSGATDGPAADHGDDSGLAGKKLSDVMVADLEELPVGSKLVHTGGDYFEKNADGSWSDHKADGTPNNSWKYESADLHSFGPAADNYTIHPATEGEHAPESSPTEGTLLKDLTDEQVLNAPVGSKLNPVGTGNHTLTKQDDGLWHSPTGATFEGHQLNVGKQYSSGDKYSFEPAKAEEPSAPSASRPENGQNLEGVSVQHIDGLPVGTKLLDKSDENGDFYVKNEDGTWTFHVHYEDGTTGNSGKEKAQSVYNDVNGYEGKAGLFELQLPGSEQPSEPNAPAESLDGKTLEGVSVGQIDALPTGTKLLDHTDGNGDFYQKQDDGSWVFYAHHDGEAFANAPESTSNVNAYVSDKAAKFQIELPKTEAQPVQLPESESVAAPKTLADLNDYSDLNSFPEGTKIVNKVSGARFEKMANGMWAGYSSSGEHLDNYYAASLAGVQNGSTAPNWEIHEPSSATSGPQVKPIGEMTASEIQNTPLGTEIHMPDGSKLVKETPSQWQHYKADGSKTSIKMKNSDVHHLSDGPNDVTPVHIPETAPEATSMHDIKQGDKMPASLIEQAPVSTLVSAKDENGNTHLFYKDGENSWMDAEETHLTDADLMEHAQSEGDLTFENEKSLTPSFAPGTAFTYHSTDEAPVGTMVSYIQPINGTERTATKTGENEWTLDNGQKEHDNLFSSEANFFKVVDPSEAAPSNAKQLTDLSDEEVKNAPIGSKITHKYTGTVHTKTGPDEWSAHQSQKNTDDHVVTWKNHPALGDKYTFEAGKEAKVGEKLNSVETAGLPVGSQIKPEGTNNHFEKIADNEWINLANGLDKYSSDQLLNSNYAGKNMEVTHLGDGNSEYAPMKFGDLVSEPQQIHDMATKSQISVGGKVWTKVDDNEWKANTGQTIDSIDMVQQAMSAGDAFFYGVQDANPSLPGKYSQPIHLGDGVVWENKGVAGKVIGLDEVNNKVQITTDDGKVKWYSASKLASLPKPKPQQYAPKATGETDPSSPWFEKPKPEIGEIAQPEAPSHIPAGFLDEIKQRYADHVNPKWSATKTDVTESGYWSRIKGYIESETPSQSELNFLHEKMYISDEMLQKATDALKAHDNALAGYHQAVADAQVKYQQDLKAWKAANGVVSKGLVDLPVRDFGKSWTPEDGYITNADGTQSANWTMAPHGSYSVDKILSSLSDEDLAKHGLSAMIDSSDIVGNNVRFTKVSDEHGNVRIQAKFEVSEASRQKVIDSFNHNGAKESYGVQNGFLGFVTKGFSKFITGVQSLTGHGQDSSGKTYDKHLDGVDIKFQAANTFHPTYHYNGVTYRNNTGALRSEAYITLPENATTADFEKGLKALGINDAHPSTEDAVNFSKRKMIVSTFKGWVADADTTYEANPNKLVKDSNDALASIGKSLDDFELVHAGNGFYQFKMPEDLRQKYTEQSGLGYLYHGNYDWIPIDKNRYNYDTADFMSWTPEQGVERITNRFINGAKGLLSTARRMLEGDDAKGMSPDSDIDSGGSKYLFTTGKFKEIATGDVFHTNNYMTGGVAHPSVAFKYLGTPGNGTDNLAGYRKEGSTLLGNIQKYKNSHPGQNYDFYEIMMHNGLSAEDMWFYFLPAKQKPVVIEKLKEAGIDEINGIPVEEFFVVPGVDKIPEYNDVDPATLGLPTKA